MTISYAMGQKLDNHESSNVTQFNSCKMLKKDVRTWMISVRTCWAIAAAVILASMVCPSLATAATSNDKHDATLIAFPRVGRSISDDEYYMMKKESGERDEAEPSLSNFPSSFEVPIPSLGKRMRIHTRASKGSMMAFPRVGKRSIHAFPRVGKRSLQAFPRVGRSEPIDHYIRHSPKQEQNNEPGKLSDDQGFKAAVQNNDLYQFLHSMLREIAKTQQNSGLTDLY
jgi:hypothetical protein